MSKPIRVAVMLDLDWPYKRHVDIFSGTQRYAQQHGWETTVDEYADDTLPNRRTKEVPYDGVIARATSKLARRASLSKIPVVNVWMNSPAQQLPSVYADMAMIGRMRAEHLLARGFRQFACLTFQSSRAHRIEVGAFRQTLSEYRYACHSAKIPQQYSQTLTNWRKAVPVIKAWMKPPLTC